MTAININVTNWTPENLFFSSFIKHGEGSDATGIGTIFATRKCSPGNVTLA